MTGGLRIVHLDTHVVVWLYTGAHQKLRPAAADALNRGLLRVSPMVRLELAYLAEIGRLLVPPERVLRELENSIGLYLDDQPFDRVADIAAGLTFARDPFDRIITAQAIAAKAHLVTADERIRAAYPDLVLWE